VQQVARRYATALADVVIPRGEAPDVQDELKVWEELLHANANLREVFANPTIALDKKRAVLKRLIEVARPRPATLPLMKRMTSPRRIPARSAAPPATTVVTLPFARL